jgi:superfamily II DNA helicase RecQ
VEALRAWRLGEARRLRVPAFHILHERTLMAIAAANPGNEAALLGIHGMGPTRVQKYGQAILRALGRGE